MGLIFANDAYPTLVFAAGMRMIVECITNSVSPSTETHPAFSPDRRNTQD
jgi:hypothetical protein